MLTSFAISVLASLGWILVVLQGRVIWVQGRALRRAGQSLQVAREELAKSSELMSVVTRQSQMAGGPR